MIYVYPNDNINLEINGKTGEILKINTQNKKRTKELLFEVNFRKEFSYDFMVRHYGEVYRLSDSVTKKKGEEIRDMAREGKTDGVVKAYSTVLPKWRPVYEEINAMYNKQMEYILKNYNGSAKGLQAIIDDIYFSFMGKLQSNAKYSELTGLKYYGKLHKQNKVAKIPDSNYFRPFDYKRLFQSKEYRDYLFDYIRFTYSNKEIPIAEALKFREIQNAAGHFETGNYLSGLILFQNYPDLRDWFLAKSIVFSFQHYDVPRTELLYEDYLKRAQDGVFKEQLKLFYNVSKIFKPGLKAPDFTLPDENGKMISLSDFKGKVVYIDFWGVHCRPCIAEIKAYAKDVHDKYDTKDVVFINICVDETTKNWKEKIKELELTGINLKAEMGDSVTTKYRINATPHHILIDREGNFVNYNGEGLHQLRESLGNSIDRALKK